MNKVRSRIVVVESVYYQQDPDPATLVESRYSRWLETEDYPMIRRANATGEWLPLCCRGVATVGSMLILQNIEGRHQFVQPTDKERKELEGKVLEVGIHVDTVGVAAPFASIRPGESMRISPENLPDLRIRCRNGTARYMLALFPS